jgi:hypothetical protein
VIVERAGAMSPMNAAGSVSATASPLPRRSNGPLARHSIRKLTDAGIWFGPKNWNESITGTSCISSTARRPERLTQRLRSSAGTVQNRPEAMMPPLKSWTCVGGVVGVPEPGTKRSSQMNPNVANRRFPVRSM